MKNIKILEYNLKNHLSNFENLKANNHFNNKLFKAIDLIKSSLRNGGKIIFEGTPENLINCNQSITARYLKKKLLF